MKKLRWAMDGGVWDLDISTPTTLDGAARPVPLEPLPLGISRGVKLSRPKQMDFFQRFMSMPFVPSFSTNQTQKGFAIQRLVSLPMPFTDRLFVTALGQFNVQQFVRSLRKNKSIQKSEGSSWFQNLKAHLAEKSLYACNFCSELLLTPDDTLLLSAEQHGCNNMLRKKALLTHKFPNHDFTIEAAWEALFTDEQGSYWDKPFTLAVDLASVSSNSGLSYHFCVNHSEGLPKEFEGQSDSQVPITLLPGVSAKSAVAYKKNVGLWRSDAPKLKMQPYDIFLSDPHISASGTVGAVVTASVGENSIRAQEKNEYQNWKGLHFRSQGVNSSLYFHGSFLLICALDFPSDPSFEPPVAYDLYNGLEPKAEAKSVQYVQCFLPFASSSVGCFKLRMIAGPFSFRVDSGVAIDLKKRNFSWQNPVFAIEYALQVLGSAKAIAWYAPNQKEFMIELRFFET
ncbi:hypothetical protein Leryth_026532 [Lithospermum erythrorhizon]|nr:hypothetical protein Leryth_026532 [Lithospermum erythrorhizon]